MAVHVTTTQQGWVFSKFHCEACGHDDVGAVFMKSTASASTGLMQDLDETRAQSRGLAQGGREEAGDALIALAACPKCGQRDELQVRSLRSKARPWLAWGGVFFVFGVGAAGYLHYAGGSFGWFLFSPIIGLGLVVAVVGLVKRGAKLPGPKSVIFHSVDPSPWAGAR